MQKDQELNKPTGGEGEKTSTSSSGPLGKENKRKNRQPFEIPKLGQPGGRDDPLRKGLSGAGVRKFQRLLHQRLAPEGARKQVLQQHKSTNYPTPKVTPTGKGKGKRGPELITPPEDPF